MAFIASMGNDKTKFIPVVVLVVVVVGMMMMTTTTMMVMNGVGDGVSRKTKQK